MILTSGSSLIVSNNSSNYFTLWQLAVEIRVYTISTSVTRWRHYFSIICTLQYELGQQHKKCQSMLKILHDTKYALKKQPKTLKCCQRGENLPNLVTLISTWLILLDGEAEENDDQEGGQGRLPVHQEHDDDAENGPEQRDPLVVKFKTWSPALK